MTKEKGRKRERQLPDLGIYPSDECYEPPPGEETDIIPYPLQLAAGHKAGVVQGYRQNTSVLVSFSVWQDVYEEGEWHHVVRIDSWHGNVHRHDFTKSGENRRTLLEEIPTVHPERVIGRWRDAAEDIIMAEWEDNVGRWRGDEE